MPTIADAHAAAVLDLAITTLALNPFSLSLYGDPTSEIERDSLLESIRSQGILVPLVVTPDQDGWEVLSGHRRLACAQALNLPSVPCQIRHVPRGTARRQAVLEYNRQRHKTFSQTMREADALEDLLGSAARRRRESNLRRGEADSSECRNSDTRTGRTDETIARTLGLGGKDLYRQARAIWKAAQADDIRAQSAVPQLDAGTKTIHAAYKDLRRRDRFTTGFQPTPYDVWLFRHDRAFGVVHPGSIPAAIVAHTLHYYTTPDALVVDPMAGGGTTLDVCTAMGRRCLAYDLNPVRPDVRKNDVNSGFPLESHGCDLVFCDPPYHTMLAAQYGAQSVAAEPLARWIEFLGQFARAAIAALRPGGVLALLLANQTEKDLPAGHGYLDHAFFGYQALVTAGFLPERRVSCPMAGAYLPQHVRQARDEGRMLGQVRDLLIMRKPKAESRLGQWFPAGQLVYLPPDERVREGGVAADDRLGQ